MEPLEAEIRTLIVTSLALEDVAPEEIDPEAPLFGEGLGLDSIDALELGIALQKAYGIRIDASAEQTREHFRSVRNLATFVASQRSAEDA